MTLFKDYPKDDPRSIQWKVRINTDVFYARLITYCNSIFTITGYFTRQGIGNQYIFHDETIRVQGGVAFISSYLVGDDGY